MPLDTQQKQFFNQGAQPSDTVQTVTVGIVVDTNDPQEMGRVRAVCPQWGDSLQTPVENLPWAVYLSPFGGQTSKGSRGPGIQESDGGIAYGMWAVPKVGAQVAVMCIDGDPMYRMYIGCIYDQFTPHTMPHGRWMYEDHPALDKTGAAPAPYGPYTSREHSIQPLYDNTRQAFGDDTSTNYERRTRAADYSVSAIGVESLDYTHSKAQDDKSVTVDGWSATNGYQASRIDPHAPSSLRDKNYDSQVVAITSPGFHAVSMDDRQENCRIRMRTTSGHQIIMDDTNERIYISTAHGNNWVEMDQDGNIDIYSSNKVNIHSADSINLTADKTVRIHGGEGVHIYSGAAMNIQSVGDVSVKSDANIRAGAGVSTFIQAANTMNIRSGNTMLLTGSTIHLNGPTAAAASPKPAMWTSRVPDHEPWARTMTSSDYSHTAEFSYTDSSVNRSERGRTIERGMFWRR